MTDRKEEAPSIAKDPEVSEFLMEGVSQAMGWGASHRRTNSGELCDLLVSQFSGLVALRLSAADLVGRLQRSAENSPDNVSPEEIREACEVNGGAFLDSFIAMQRSTFSQVFDEKERLAEAAAKEPMGIMLGGLLELDKAAQHREAGQRVMDAGVQEFKEYVLATWRDVWNKTLGLEDEEEEETDSAE